MGCAPIRILREGLVAVQDIFRVLREQEGYRLAHYFGMAHEPAFLFSVAKRRLSQLGKSMSNQTDLVWLPVSPELVQIANISIKQAVGIEPIPVALYCELLRLRLERFARDGGERRRGTHPPSNDESSAEYLNDEVLQDIERLLGKERTIDYLDSLWRDLWLWDSGDYKGRRYKLLLDTPVSCYMRDDASTAEDLFVRSFRVLVAKPLRRLALVKQTAGSLSDFLRSLVPLEVTFGRLRELIGDYLQLQHSDIPAARTWAHGRPFSSSATEVLRRLSQLTQTRTDGTLGGAIVSDRPSVSDIHDLLSIDRTLDEYIVDIKQLLDSPLGQIEHMLQQSVGPSMIDRDAHYRFWNKETIWDVDPWMVAERVRFFGNGRIYVYQSLAERLIRLLTSFRCFSAQELNDILRRVNADLTRELSLGFQAVYSGVEN